MRDCRGCGSALSKRSQKVYYKSRNRGKGRCYRRQRYAGGQSY